MRIEILGMTHLWQLEPENEIALGDTPGSRNSHATITCAVEPVTHGGNGDLGIVAVRANVWPAISEQ